MKQIKTEDAVGHVLCHDITQIVKGVTKDAAFRKGHVVREEDIPLLLSLGKDHLYIWEAGENMVHEDDAAGILYALCAGEHMRPSDVKEGKIEVIADCDGVVLVDTQKLRRINAAGEMMIATRHSGMPVKRGDKLAGTRIIPMVIQREKLEEAQGVGAGLPILTLNPFTLKKVSIIATGNEIFYNRIPDTFTPVIEEKVTEFGAAVFEKAVLGDEPQAITARILETISHGADMVVCTGGMSVDPDDKTPLAIKRTGAEIVSYGAPVLPGAMFMLAYFINSEKNIPVLGLPGCVMYAKRTIFDLVLPRIMAGIPISSQDLAGLGHGGLCLSCDVCTYPNCGFGKGQ
ncbi:MAG: molybdopterin-binding protein [Peptococcaceae bacterium]|nr:molybdopterin-binding protein [Peptococcaceae bacterium]